MSATLSFFAELKRRNVLRLAGLYLIDAWLLVQVAGTVLPMFGAPDWLEERYREWDGFTIGAVRVDRFLNPLRGNSRFEALAEKIMPAREFAKAAPTSK